MSRDDKFQLSKEDQKIADQLENLVSGGLDDIYFEDIEKLDLNGETDLDILIASSNLGNAKESNNIQYYDRLDTNTVEDNEFLEPYTVKEKKLSKTKTTPKTNTKTNVKTSTKSNKKNITAKTSPNPMSKTSAVNSTNGGAGPKISIDSVGQSITDSNDMRRRLEEMLR